MDFTKYWNIFWTLTFALTSVVITIGNLITTVIFLKQKLRKRPHFLLISLAIADLMVGAFAVPLYIAVGICTTKRLLILTFQCVDIFTGVLSTFTLASISLETDARCFVAFTPSNADVAFLHVCHRYPLDPSSSWHFSPSPASFLYNIETGFCCHHYRLSHKPSSFHMRCLLSNMEEAKDSSSPGKTSTSRWLFNKNTFHCFRVICRNLASIPHNKHYCFVLHSVPRLAFCGFSSYETTSVW